MARITVRKGMPSVALTKAEFTERARERFFDPAFASLQTEIGEIIDAAWDGYHKYRKAPRTRKAGRGYAAPDYDLSIDWLKTRDAVARAERRQKSADARSRILLINGSMRSNQTCPGEISKTWRLVEMALKIKDKRKKIREVRTQCGPPTHAKITVFDRNKPVQKQAMEHFGKVLTLWKSVNCPWTPTVWVSVPLVPVIVTG